jgi:predicted DNA-binding protein YlxM (UPF0122 family)
MNRISHVEQLLVWRKRRELALSLHKQNYSLSEIAKRLDCSSQRVHQIITKQKGRK